MPPRSGRTKAVVFYAEKSLHATLSLPNETTVSVAKEKGMEEMRKRLGKSGVPAITMDPECTDFYPVPATETTAIGDLNGAITMVLWPQADPNTNLTPSPIMDTLAGTTLQLKELRAEQAAQSLINQPIATTSSKKHGRKKRSAPSTPTALPDPSASYDSQMAAIMLRLDILETGNAVLKSGNDVLKSDNAVLKSDNAVLKLDNAVLKSDNAVLISDNAVVISDNAVLKAKITSLEDSVARLKVDKKAMKDYIDDLTMEVKDTSEWITIGDEGALDRIKLRNLLDRAQGLLADKLALPSDEPTRSLDFRMALGPSSDLGARKERLLTMLQRTQAAFPELAGLLNSTAALNLLAERYPSIRIAGDAIAHGKGKWSWYHTAISRSTGNDKSALMTLLNFAALKE